MYAFWQQAAAVINVQIKQYCFIIIIFSVLWCDASFTNYIYIYTGIESNLNA